MDPTDNSNSTASYENAWNTTAGSNQVCAESCSLDTASSVTETSYCTSTLFGD